MSLTRRYAEFAAGLTYEDLPAEAVRTVKRLILDTLGCSLAGTTFAASEPVIAVMRALGGPPESTILGSRTKVAAANAAFVNGALSNALNYSAAGVDAGHTGIPVLAAPLALAEARAPVSGARFIVAAALAAEITTRTSLASASIQHLGAQRLLLSGQYFGYFGAAAAAGSILGFNATAMHSTFGLALMQISGTRQVIVAGDPPAKAIFGAFPNHGGVLAALLAEAGLGAEIDAIDGTAGFYALVGGAVDRELLLDGLGTRFRLVEATFKPWPTSGVVTPFIEAAIELATRYDLHPDEIAAVEVIGSSHLRQWCEPVAERRQPSNAASAANSTLYPTAVALVHRAVTLADFTDAGLHDPIVLALAEKTSYRPDDRVRGGIVAIRTIDGRELEAKVEQPLGTPERPLHDDGLWAKFRDCCTFAPELTPDDAEALIDFVEHLELADDVSPLANLTSLLAWTVSYPGSMGYRQGQ